MKEPFLTIHIASRLARAHRLRLRFSPEAVPTESIEIEGFSSLFRCFRLGPFAFWNSLFNRVFFRFFFDLTLPLLFCNSSLFRLPDRLSQCLIFCFFGRSNFLRLLCRMSSSLICYFFRSSGLLLCLIRLLSLLDILDFLCFFLCFFLSASGSFGLGQHSFKCSAVLVLHFLLFLLSRILCHVYFEEAAGRILRYLIS